MEGTFVCLTVFMSVDLKSGQSASPSIAMNACAQAARVLAWGVCVETGERDRYNHSLVTFSPQQVVYLQMYMTEHIRLL